MKPNNRVKPMEWEDEFRRLFGDEIDMYAPFDAIDVKAYIRSLLLQERKSIIKEIERYFDDLIMIPNPQLTKDSLIKKLQEK